MWVLDRATGEFINAWPLVENSNWIEGIDENGKLIGRNEPIVGETKLLCPADHRRAQLESRRVQSQDRVGSTRPVSSGASKSRRFARKLEKG